MIEVPLLIVNQDIREYATGMGWRLWRNNSGAGKVGDRFMRWGLCNESQAMNEMIKSSDYIGITDTGLFVALEEKPHGWKYRATLREQAQLRFIKLVTEFGGIGSFIIRSK